jgi:formylglycine-generating enzyme required for sulfatase activity
MKMKSNYLILIFLLLLTGNVLANNILVSNATLNGQNKTNHTSKINFDVSWENSWRTSTNESNYDGAWVFVKFRKNGTTDWRHCTIDGSNYIAATSSTMKVPPDGKGIFIYRSADGIGNISYIGNQIQWDYGTDGIADNETVEIQVFALEMVYIPAGNFYLGSGGNETNAFRDGQSNNPFLVTNATINFGTAPGNLNTMANDVTPGAIPAAFPTGAKAFWIMKYECTQQQYVDFLNHLDLAAATADKTDVITGVHPNLIAPQPERGIGQLGFNRMAALADWSCLRPYTEMEFVKICRGANTPAVPNEYPWGNTVFVQLASVSNAGAANETVSNPANANVNVYSYGLPTRAGIFARSTSDRTASGAAFYGVMNMGDNLREITVATTQEGLFLDAQVHGDGYLNTNGDGKSNIPEWTNHLAYGVRGAGYASSGTAPWIYARTSDRIDAKYFIGSDDNNSGIGVRLARTDQ